MAIFCRHFISEIKYCDRYDAFKTAWAALGDQSTGFLSSLVTTTQMKENVANVQPDNFVIEKKNQTVTVSAFSCSDIFTKQKWQNKKLINSLQYLPEVLKWSMALGT